MKCTSIGRVQAMGKSVQKVRIRLLHVTGDKGLYDGAIIMQSIMNYRTEV